MSKIFIQMSWKLRIQPSASTEMHTCVQAGVIMGFTHVLKKEHVLYMAELGELAFPNSK